MGWCGVVGFVRESIELSEYPCVADTGRKRTLFHCKWVNSISYISRMLY